MLCSKCGKQIPNETKFCNHCGAEQKTADTSTNQPENAPKKNSNIIIVLVIALCAFFIGKFVIAPSFSSDSDNDTSNQVSQSQLIDNNGGASNPTYDAIFDGTGIVHWQTFFGMNTKSFAFKNDEGNILCADYGYTDDVVKEYVETLYFPISEYTEAEKTELQNVKKSQFAAVDALNCCTVTYKMGTYYFSVTCTYTDVDKAENYSELYNAQILESNTWISMSAMERSLLNQGFVKK